MNKEAKMPRVRLLTAAVVLFIILSDIAFSFFLTLGPVYGRMVPAALCTFIIVIVTPVMFRGSWKIRLCAASIATLPALFLLRLIVSMSGELIGGQR